MRTTRPPPAPGDTVGKSLHRIEERLLRREVEAAGFKFVAPGFFTTMGTPLVAGRDYTWTDIYEERKYAIVSKNTAREMWHSPAAALGKMREDCVIGRTHIRIGDR